MQITVQQNNQGHPARNNKFWENIGSTEIYILVLYMQVQLIPDS